MELKEITPELVEKILTARGFGENNFNDYNALWDAVLKHYNLTITDDWRDGLDFYIYEEDTADGYSVFVATSDPNRVNINSEVHYYDSQLDRDLQYAILPGDVNVYVHDLDAHWVEDAFYRLYEDMMVLLYNEVTDELLDEGYVEITTK